MATHPHSPSSPNQRDRSRAPDAVPASALRSALDAVAEAVIITDADGGVRYWNAAATRLYGFEPQEAVGQSLDALILALGRQPAAPLLARAEPDRSTGETEWLTRDRAGRRFWVTATSMPLAAGETDGDQTLVVIADTARKKVAFEAAQSVALSPMRDDKHEVIGVSGVVRDMTSHLQLQREVDRQSALFTALSRRSSDVAIVTDPEANITYVSPSVAEVFGYRGTDATGLAAWGFVHPDDLPTVQTAVNRVLAQPDGLEELTIRIRDSRGGWRWVEQTITNCVSEPEIGGLVANLRDVTAQVHAQEELRRSEARYRAIAETAREGIGVLTPTGGLVFANQKLADIAGLSLEETYRVSLGSLFDKATTRDLVRRLGNRPELGSETYELPYDHPDGSQRWLSVSAAPLPLAETGEVASLVMVADVTQEREAEKELRHQALHDVLTGLPNRALLSDRLQMALARQHRTPDGSVAVMFLDLDQFKMVNDSLGHDAGDLLLVEVGHRLQQSVRSGDTVARLGGDEFAVLCEAIDETNALLLAERLRARLVEAVDLDGHRLSVDASIGIALTPPHDSAALLRYADAAMYQAKSDGRGRTRVFNARLASSAERRLMVMSRLRESLRTGDGLDLHYQPIVEMGTGAVQGVEALLRWHDDRLGRVSPLEVIAAAESTGLSSVLDQWVLAKACADLAGLAADPRYDDLYLSVNLSASNIGATPLDELVPRVAARTGWPASRLVLEVTESAIMTDPESAAVLLGRLRDQGVSVAVDDFGTGYSSLAYLKRLPVGILKIDQSFVEQATTDADSLSIVTAIVDLARGLGLRTIAEGIERPEQAEAMRALGCVFGQGFLWSPAVPLGDLASLLAGTGRP